MIELLREHFQALWRTLPRMTEAQASASIRGAIGLLKGWISAEGTVSKELSPEVSAALGKTVRCYIERHLDQTMEVEDLARRFRISRSQLYLMFAPYNGVASYIRERRLQRSRRMLTNPSFLHKAIGAIGFDNGFTSESQFSRAFRARFAVTPRQVRDEMRVLLRNNPQPASGTDSKEYPDDIRELVKKLAMFSGAESRT
jgi:AraC-like DNA-binding protein